MGRTNQDMPYSCPTGQECVIFFPRCIEAGEAGAGLVSARYLVIVLPRLLSVVSWFIAAAAPRQGRCCRRAERGAHLSFCFLTVAAAGEWDSVRYFSIGGGSGRWAELTAPLHIII